MNVRKSSTQHRAGRAASGVALLSCVAALVLGGCGACDSPQTQTPAGPPSITMVELRSSVIKGASYDTRTKTMRLRFVQGHVREYRDVEPAVYQGLLAAESHGKYYNRRIKGRYQSKRIK